MYSRPMSRKLVAFGLLLCACGGSHASSPGGLVQVSAASPFTAGCADVAGDGQVYANAAVEPSMAINPLNPNNLVAVWQQDRWSNGGSRGIGTGASFDGGHSWARTLVPFTICAGGAFERASDPWVSFAPDGTAWQIALVFNQSTADRGVSVASSIDGGRSWSAPRELEHDTDPNLGMDKETVTADPLDPSRVYAVWDRIDHFTVKNSPLAHGPAFFSRTVDGGRNWSQPQNIYDPGADAQTIGNQIAVLPDGTLLNLLMIITANSTRNPNYSVDVMRSTDQGVSWSPPIAIATVDVTDIPAKSPSSVVRTGNLVPSLAVDASTGRAFAAWQDGTAIVLSTSGDGGQSWSRAAKVNQSGAAAFTPVASAAPGRVAVSYTDLRHDNPADPAHLIATNWLAISADGGQTWKETPISPDYDLQSAPYADGYFVGDYQALVHSGTTFLPLFAMVNGEDQSNRTDIFFRPAVLSQ